ncbi:hypothetical protein [Sphingopyxis sp. R3-92]|uniref:hypothetical protein n=1 Tax=Sphingopyxis sp. R3-92 TaxID=3158553 RepID=UPI003EE7A78C
MKRSKLFGVVTDFCLFLVLLSAVDLLFRYGLNFDAWNLASARLAYNAIIAAVIAIVLYLRGSSR